LASYVYSEVQKAIGGNSSKSGFQKSWSPNRIRALFVMRNYILVVDYLTGPKLHPINPDLVAQDLQNPSRVGFINNLLTDRQLSCLEEIYADEVFARVPNVLDLQVYSQSVMNSASRLRYFAYTVIPDGNKLKGIYLQAFNSGIIDFTYAKNVGGIRYVDTNNKDWYKKHNLRPQFYGPDVAGGNLEAWFNKVERLTAKQALAQEALNVATMENSYILKRVYADIGYLPVINKLSELYVLCKGFRYELRKGFVESARHYHSTVKPVSGLSRELIIKAVEAGADISAKRNIKSVMFFYDHTGLYQPSATFDVQVLESSGAYPEDTGFINIAKVLDFILANLYEKYGSNASYKYVLNVAIMNNFANGIPDGALAKRLTGRAKVIDRPVKDFVNSYMSAICFICGVSEDQVSGGSY
jgi:hypothetical protein